MKGVLNMSGHMLCTETSQLTRTQVYVRSTTNELLTIKEYISLLRCSVQQMSCENSAGLSWLGDRQLVLLFS